MPRIFISYRRYDSISISGCIYDRLLAHFGDGNVFQDVDDIPFGIDFRTHLRNEIDRYDVVLVIIGPYWLRIIDKHGRKRLDDPADFVRIEVEIGLRRGKLVIPVLVDGATMPLESELARSLRDLCYRNAVLVRHNPDFDHDMSRLIDGIEHHFGVNQRKITLPESVAILPPPFEWCIIPAGKVPLTELGKYDSSSAKASTYDVSEFAIAKYPITNAQYQIFVETNDGYSDPKWWNYSEHAKKWRADNSKPAETTFKGNDLPRERINWFDANAFCYWLSVQLGLEITLPTDAEWRRAAQGDDNRFYPWGNDFDQNRANTSESGLKMTSSVMYYAEGVSPFGVFDMIGNVWEWCLNSRLGHLNELEITSDDKRIVHGGSHIAPADRCTIRFNYVLNPLVYHTSIGFRVVCTSLPKYGY